MDEYVYLPWNPSPAQFEQYKARERELAGLNLIRDPYGPSLHSDATVRATFRNHFATKPVSNEDIESRRLVAMAKSKPGRNKR